MRRSIEHSCERCPPSVGRFPTKARAWPNSLSCRMLVNRGRTVAMFGSWGRKVALSRYGCACYTACFSVFHGQTSCLSTALLLAGFATLRSGSHRDGVAQSSERRFSRRVSTMRVSRKAPTAAPARCAPSTTDARVDRVPLVEACRGKRPPQQRAGERSCLQGSCLERPACSSSGLQ